MVIRRVHVASAAKISGLLYVCIGLIAGLVFASISLVGAGIAQQAGEDSGMPAIFGAFFGVGAIVFLPICYGIIGAISGAFFAAVYNALAGMIGGLQIDVE